MKTILLLLLASSVSAGEITVDNGVSVYSGDTRYVNSPTETAAQAFTNSSFSVGGSTLVVSAGKVGVRGTPTAGALDIQAGAQNVAFEGLSIRSVNNPRSVGDYVYQNAYLSNANGVNYEGSRITTIISAMPSSKLSTDVTFGTTASDILTEKMRITSAGNVGFGTSTPSTKIDVSSGTATFAGTGSPAKGYALCLTAAGKLSTCSNTPAADGTCTCTP